MDSDKKYERSEGAEVEEKTDSGRFNLLYKILKVSDETEKTTARLESSIDKIEKVFNVDALAPAAVCEKTETVGVTKSKLNTLTMLLLGVMAGVFIAFGGVFFTVVTTNSGLGFGMNRLVGGIVFCVGLILVVIAGGELFTGNNLIVVGWLSGRVKLTQLLRNWGIVYTANFIGSLIIVGLIFASNHWALNNNAVGVNALNIANSKVNIDFGTALVRGILCNMLVCLAVWLCFSSRTVVDKVLAIIFPITAFVAAGFEHSIANMYFIPLGMLLAGQPAVLNAAGLTAESVANLSWAGLFGNLVPVTIGNIIGGIAIGIVYWLSYLRKERACELVTARPWVKKCFPGLRDVEPLRPMNAQIDNLILAKMVDSSRGEDNKRNN